MVNYRLRFGDFDFPQSLRPAKSGGSQSLAAQPRPRGSGSVTQTGRREPESLAIVGEIIPPSTNPTADGLFALIESISAAAYSGKNKLWFGRDDRYYKDAQCATPDISWAEGLAFGIWASVSLQFSASDYPEPFAASTATPTLTAAGGTLSVAGTAPTFPQWTITVGTSGTGAFLLTNAATGESALLDAGTSGWAAGDVIILRRDGYKVFRNGVETFGLLQYRIPSLVSGSNVISLSATGTATASALAVEYIPRFR